MIIGIEAERANHPNPTGVEHYSRQLILALAEIDSGDNPSNEYILYLRTKPMPWMRQLPKNFKTKVLGYGPLRFPYAWTQLRLSWEMLIAPPDVLFIPAASLPLIHPKNSVVTVHDLAWVFYPETYGKFRLLHLKFSTWLGARFAKKVIAVSQQTKNDLMRAYRLPAEKIDVVYHGFNAETELIPEGVQSQQLPILPEKFILFLSTLQPRKNVLRLIDAFIELKKEQNIPHSLVLVGGRGWLSTYEEVLAKIKNHPEVLYLGYVNDRFSVLSKAAMLVQPALYEGFGLQVLDAFACRVPVACSNISSLPEVAGDAAVYFNPIDTAQIKNAMKMILADRSLCERLVEKGNERLAEFTWKKCAEKTLGTFKAAAAEEYNT